jgi:hypothetical protein
VTHFLLISPVLFFNGLDFFLEGVYFDGLLLDDRFIFADLNFVLVIDVFILLLLLIREVELSL